MSTMQSLSSSTTSPPEPMIAPRCGQGFVIDRRVGQLGGNAAARGAADLHRLETPLAPVAVGQAGARLFGHAAADLLDDLPHGDAHRHLDQAAAADFAGQRENLRAGTLWRAEPSEGLGAVAEDPRRSGHRFPRC